jgi:hypothetical protein
MHIILVGASHGWRLFQALKRVPGYGIIFKVTCLCVRGAWFADLFWPQTVKKDDFLVVIPFGNDLHIRRFVRFDKYSKVFHLDKFVPCSTLLIFYTKFVKILTGEGWGRHGSERP